MFGSRNKPLVLEYHRLKIQSFETVLCPNTVYAKLSVAQHHVYGILAIIGIPVPEKITSSFAS